MSDPDRIARTLLYEGYVLFPYRASALKNRVRASAGDLCPAAGWGRAHASTEIPLELGSGGSVSATVALLQPVRRSVVDADGREVPALGAGADTQLPWEEAREQRFDLGPLHAGRLDARFTVPALDERRPASGGHVLRSATEARLDVSLRLRAVTVASVEPGRAAYVLEVHVANTTPEPCDSTRSILHSVHVILRVAAGAFVSVIEPPEAWAGIAQACEPDGLWPVLLGPRSDRTTALLSPIIVYDHPELAPESPGETFDATENDELLSLAILAMTQAERDAMRATDPRAAALLDRIEVLGTDLDGLHGAVRSFREERGGSVRVRSNGRIIGVGDAVLLAPSGRDAMDRVLAGERAIVVGIEVEASGREHLVVVLDRDPGRELGLASAGLGHRFFVSPAEVLAWEPQK